MAFLAGVLLQANAFRDVLFLPGLIPGVVSLKIQDLSIWVLFIIYSEKGFISGQLIFGFFR